MTTTAPASASSGTAPATGSPRVLRTTFHFQAEKQKKEFKAKVFAKTFLMGTHLRAGAKSPVKVLQGQHGDILNQICDYASPLPKERDFYYKMGLSMCVGTEHVFVEELEQPEKLMSPQYTLCSLNSQPICGAFNCKPLLVDFLKKFACKKNTAENDNDNDDDSCFWNEGQLRAAWKDFAVERFCDRPNGNCRGLCCVISGDTIAWGYGGMNLYPVARMWKPATQADLVERGFVNPKHPGNSGKGILWQYAKIARDDPKQLEDEDENKENEGGDGNN
ncbi:expressed unknown protein [Seminavis robusta]|uniref:Uncharacterized protein n=1 Tax=Seminavis robusta TaxID=568900 RepID=A0A9N8HFH3_9STRA|nr:expressed unknown protein [Seminavis robusta]|eukprot:Sro435_g142370.1 n/a (277) ;mRNA; f:41506-42336